jgi:hypothetical protein
MQTDSNGRRFDPARYEVLLLANNCDDDSAARARSIAARHPEVPMHIAEVRLPPAQANVGHVRGLLMDEACRRLGRAPHAAGCIVSTDGDTVVAPDWLASTERALAEGAQAVGGRIAIDPRCPVEPRTLRWQRLDAAHRLARSRLEDLLDPDPADPWPRHHQHFGASLAITRQAYLQVGGLPEVRYLEDEALVDALRRHDLPVRHSPDVRVMTSSRQDGRAEVGLAWQLREWAQDDRRAKTLMVESPAGWLAELGARRALRTLWQAHAGTGLHRKPATKAVLSALVEALDLPLHWLARRTESTDCFGALWAEVQAHRGPAVGTQGAPAMVPAREAIAQLRALIAAQLAGRAARSSRSMRYVASR